MQWVRPAWSVVYHLITNRFIDKCNVGARGVTLTFSSGDGGVGDGDPGTPELFVLYLKCIALVCLAAQTRQLRNVSLTMEGMQLNLYQVSLPVALCMYPMFSETELR